MEEFKGTKQSWIVSEDVTGVCVFTERDLICRTHNKPTKAGAEANARLIAAAPELLGALQRLTNICSQEAITDRDSFYKEFDEAVAEAKKTINKALGEEQE